MQVRQVDGPVRVEHKAAHSFRGAELERTAHVHDGTAIEHHLITAREAVVHGAPREGKITYHRTNLSGIQLVANTLDILVILHLDSECLCHVREVKVVVVVVVVVVVGGGQKLYNRWPLHRFDGILDAVDSQQISV